jgi:hypothetical protein
VPENVRYFDVAGVTVRVESDLPFTDATIHKKFRSFQVDGPGPDTVVIHHHFGLPEAIPGFDGPEPPREVYRKPPWAIYRTADSWVYLGIAPDPDDPALHRVAIFNTDHTSAEIYNSEVYRAAWLEGGLTSLTMFPTDQIFLTRLVSDRGGCFLHSGGLTIDGEGFLFVGHSEAGKSTTMRLVRSRLGDRCEILCDDRNVLRLWKDGFGGGRPGYYVHGTWSHGDVPDVSSAAAPLRAILFLEQHPTNEIVAITDRKWLWQRLLATLIKPMITAEWWKRQMDVLEGIVTQVPCYTMRFDKSGRIVDELEKLAQ